MDIIKLFRVLICASLVFFAAGLAAAFTGPEPPEAVTAWLDDEAAGSLFGWLYSASDDTILIAGGFAAFFLVAWIAGLVGMFRFRRWGRGLFVATAVLALAMMPFMGVLLHGPLEGTFDALIWATDGALLALLCVEPVRARFQ